MIHNRQCFLNHMGVWMMAPDFLGQAVSLIKRGIWTPQQATSRQEVQAAAGERVLLAGAAEDAPPAYTLANGTAVVPLIGPIMKGFSKYGGASSIHVRQSLRQAAADPSVKDVLLQIDSPGGHVAGTAELADEVTKTRASKPVHAQIEDLGASAAYWAASAAETISMNKMGRAGSIGTYAVIYDDSKQMASNGVQVHVVSTGPYKGALESGTPILPEHLADVARIVAEANAPFSEAVKAGRKMSDALFAAVSDGRTWGASDAKRMGLVDHIRSTEDTIAAIQMARPTTSRRNPAQARGHALALAQRNLVTVASLCETLGKNKREILWALSSANIEPLAEVGTASVYDGSCVPQVRQRLREIAARK